MIQLKMCGVLAIVDVASILSLDFVGFLTNNFGDLVRSFPGWAELTRPYLFGVLEDSAQYPISYLEGPHSDVFVIVVGYLLLVDYSVEVSLLAEFIDSVKAMIKQLLISVVIKPLVSCRRYATFDGKDSLSAICKRKGCFPSGSASDGLVRPKHTWQLIGQQSLCFLELFLDDLDDCLVG